MINNYILINPFYRMYPNNITSGPLAKKQAENERLEGLTQEERDHEGHVQALAELEVKHKITEGALVKQYFFVSDQVDGTASRALKVALQGIPHTN